MAAHRNRICRPRPGHRHGRQIQPQPRSRQWPVHDGQWRRDGWERAIGCDGPRQTGQTATSRFREHHRAHFANIGGIPRGGRTSTRAAPPGPSRSDPTGRYCRSQVPAEAPRTIRFSDANMQIFDLQRRLSFPAGHQLEQGGTVVSDALGRLSVQNLGGLGRTGGSFTPNLAAGDPSSYSVQGTFHTHPYDHRHQSVNGVPYSGGDMAQLINSHLTISLVQSGPRQFALVRTANAPDHIDYDGLNRYQTDMVRRLQTQGQTFQQASRIAASRSAARFGLAYDQGSHGKLTRVEPE